MATTPRDVPRHYYSLEEYFALERASDVSAWERRDVTDLDASLNLESIGCALKMRDIYDGLTFPA